MAELTENIEKTRQFMGQWSAGEFHTSLRERRSVVLSHLEGQLRAAVIAEVVFDLLVHLALNPDIDLDAQLIESFAWRHELDAKDVVIQRPNGRRVQLVPLLTDSNSLDDVELVNALLTIGFNGKLKPLEDVDRQSFTIRIVGLLPGIERIGPYTFCDYLDLVCSEEDAGRFWQIYTERLATEINKRSEESSDKEIPWLLHHLLRFHRHGLPETRGRAWVTLRRHIRRILRIDRNRAQFIRMLLETVDDMAVLHYVCSSPGFVSDSQLLHQLLVRGEEKLISCALFALQIHGELDHVVARTIEHYRSRPLPEVAHRVTEIYAQLALPVQPNANLKYLTVGLRSVILDHVAGGGSVESLAQAIANDTRALRHCLLIADLSRVEEFRTRPHGQRLLDRVVTVFFQSFTPAAIDHPFNDEVFANAMVRVLKAMIQHGAGRIRDRLESFGLELSDHVDRWTGEDIPEHVRRKLLARFAIFFVRTVIAVARVLHSDEETAEQGRNLYRTLIKVYLEHHKALEGDSSFGAIAFSLQPLFPEMMSRGLEQIEIGDIIDASHVMARIENEFGAFDDLDALEGDEARKKTGVSALILRKPDRDAPLMAPVQVLDRRQTNMKSILRAYLGLDLLAHLKEKLLRLLGLTREGSIILTDRELVVSSKRTLAGQVFERTGDSHALDDLLAVNVKRRLRLFYVVLGALGLVFTGVVGGHLLFVGLRGADSSLAILGGAAIGLGIVFDAAMTRISERNENSVVVDLSFSSRPEAFTIALDTQEGAEILDAFMAGDAERRELALMEDVIRQDVEWEPLDGPIDLEA
ncbi:MAG: hypothetical protein VYA30_04220 [Myxococcota bacterium]|nr:hypothetical protein [Myxococcota bacterium]